MPEDGGRAERAFLLVTANGRMLTRNFLSRMTLQF